MAAPVAPPTTFQISNGNKQVHRSAQIRIPDSIPGGANHPAYNEILTEVDALKGYNQIPLDEESSALTTFSTP